MADSKASPLQPLEVGTPPSPTLESAGSTSPTLNNQTVLLLKSVGDVLISSSAPAFEEEGLEKEPKPNKNGGNKNKDNTKDEADKDKDKDKDLTVKFDPTSHEVSFKVKNSELEAYANTILRRVAHLIQMEVTYTFIGNLNVEVKKEVLHFLTQFTNIGKKGTDSLILAHSNMARIWEGFAKCTSLIRARVNTSNYPTMYTKRWKEYLTEAGVSCSLTVESTKFDLKPLLTYSYDATPGIFPLKGDCFRLGSIIRNAVAHNQIIRDKLDLDALCMLYPQLAVYEPLMLLDSNNATSVSYKKGQEEVGVAFGRALGKKVWPISRRLWVNENSTHVIDVFLADRGAVSEWLCGRYNRIVAALGGEFEYRVGFESM